MGAPSLPGYSIDRLLGRGAHCEVYLARETEGLQRPVALKCFDGDRGRTIWKRELEMVRRIEEVRRRERAVEILQTLGSGEHGDLAFIALEYMERGSLQALVEGSGALPLADALEYVRQAARALVLLHGEGVFHRDVKPGNLLLGDDGRVRLADFGLSRPLEGTLSAAGSPAFAAPEVIAGKLHDGRLVDVYALGATLAFLLSGETILPGRPDVFALERQGVPRWLQQVIVTAAALDASERYSTVEQLIRALEGPEPAAAAEPQPVTDAMRDKVVHKLVDRSAYAAAAATMLPLPGTELIAVLPIHVAMVVEIGRIHGVELARESATKLVTRIGATVGLSLLGSKVATTAAKLLLPGLGGVLGAPFVYASTLALGTVADAHFEKGDLSEQEIKSLYKRALRRARKAFDPRKARSAEARAQAEEASRQVEVPEGAEESETPQDPAIRLEHLQRLFDKGLIETEELEAVRARILGEL